jgi:hypothetical protein
MKALVPPPTQACDRPTETLVTPMMPSPVTIHFADEDDPQAVATIVTLLRKLLRTNQNA